MRRERNSGEDKRQSCKLNRRSRGAGRLVSDGGGLRANELKDSGALSETQDASKGLGK